MRYYFAGRYSRHAELAEYRDELLHVLPDAVVTSRWIDCHDGELDASFTPEQMAADPEGCWKYGQHDIEDLAAARAIVSFTEGRLPFGIEKAERPSKGGRHIEHGWAIAARDSFPFGPDDDEGPFRLVIVGPRENIFHCHPDTEQFDSWGDFLAHEIGRVEVAGWQQENERIGRLMGDAP